MYLNGVPELRINFVLSISGSVFGWFLTQIGRIRGLELHWTVAGSSSIVPI